MATSYSAPIDNTEIRYDRMTRDYAVLVDGQVIGYGRNYSEAEQKRTEYLAERAEHTNACVGFGCVDGCGDCVQVAA